LFYFFLLQGDYSVESKKMQMNADEGDKFADRRDPRLFVRAPKIIIYDKKISSPAKILYFILQDYGRNGLICPSVCQLARDMGKSERQIQNLLRELEKAGLVITILQRQASNRYRLTELKAPEPTEPTEPEPPSGSKSQSPAGAARLLDPPPGAGTGATVTATTSTTATASRCNPPARP
jgi:DNA-binding transcriptional ArsR family regulator